MNDSPKPHHHELAAPPTPPSAAFIEKFLHHQEDAAMSSGEFELGLFRIDGDEDDDANERESTVELEGGSPHPSDESEPNNNNNNITSKDNWRGSLPLYTTSVDVDFAEATIVAPVDLEEGNILRIDMGLRRILVVQVPDGGVKSGEIFKAPYQIHHTPMSDLEAFRSKAYNEGHYHGWVSKLLGCCEQGAHSSSLGAICCPCILLSTVMTRMHLNWCGKHTSSLSSTARKSSQRCTMTCIVLLYTTAFVLTVLLILHIAKAIYCLEYDHLFKSNIEESTEREEEVEAIDLNTLGDDITCNYKINKAYLFSIVALDALLCGYIILLMSRTRTAIREHHYIYGGSVEDCCVSCCCNCCTLTQMANETSYEDHETRRLSNVDVSIGEPGEFLNENSRPGQHCYRPIV